MTTERHLERDLPAILGEIATGRYPDYIDDVLATTAQRRQRPTWTFPERWLPVELVTSRAPVARMPWRQLGVLALIALLLAAAIVGYVASQQARLTAPFGPARKTASRASPSPRAMAPEPAESTPGSRASSRHVDHPMAPRSSSSAGEAGMATAMVCSFSISRTA